MSSYSAAVLASAPLAYWRFGETTGLYATDEFGACTGDYRNGVVLGQAGAIANDSDKSVLLNKALSTHIRLTLPEVGSDNPIPHPGDTFTVVLWAKRASSGAPRAHLWSGGTNDIEICFDVDDTLLFQKQGGANLFQSTAHITDTQWHMYAVTKQGATFAVYFDGALMPGAYQANATIVASGIPVSIGAINGVGQYFDGNLDEYALWTRALSANEIANLYAVGTQSLQNVDYNAIAVALAARFAPAQVTAPATLHNIRLSTADIPNQLPGALPVVLVFPVEGTIETGGGTSLDSSTWFVRFYYAQTGDLKRDSVALRKWLTVLVGQLRTSVQLGGLTGVKTVKVSGWRLVILEYQGQFYSGIELTVDVRAEKTWLAVA